MRKLDRLEQRILDLEREIKLIKARVEECESNNANDEEVDWELTYSQIDDALYTCECVNDLSSEVRSALEEIL